MNCVPGIMKLQPTSLNKKNEKSVKIVLQKIKLLCFF